MTRCDPDAISEQLADIAEVLIKDVRTMPHAIFLAGIRRDISRALAVCEAAPRRVDPGQSELMRRAQLAPPCETSRQAMEQGAGDGFRVPDLEARVAAYGGRFVEVHAR